MINNRRTFYLALCMISLGFIGGIVLDHMGYFPDTAASALGIPVTSYSGYFYQGLILLIVTLIGFLLLAFSLKEKKTPMICLCLFVVVILPHLV